MRSVYVIRDVLDMQIIDRDSERLGRVDGVVGELREGQPPRVVALELGFVPLARRLSLRLERWTERLHTRWSVRRSARYHIPWDKVTHVTMDHIQVELRAEESVAHDWERWLRRNVIGRLPGGSSE